jgi:hypothetical protein
MSKPIYSDEETEQNERSDAFWEWVRKVPLHFLAWMIAYLAMRKLAIYLGIDDFGFGFLVGICMVRIWFPRSSQSEYDDEDD